MNNYHLERWEIESMELWAKDYIDCNEPGYVKINADGTGEFVFGAVSASIDGEFCKETNRSEYSWEGINDRDPICGRDWYMFENAHAAKGQLFIPIGDSSLITLAR